MKLSIKISLLASVVSIFFMLVVFTNTQHSIIKESKQHVVNDYENDLKLLKNTFDLVLTKYTDTILFFSNMGKYVYENPKVMKKKFESSMNDVPKVSSMKFISLNGKELVAVSRGRLFSKVDKNISYTNKEIFKEALKNKIYYSNIYFTKNENEMMIDISKSVTDIMTHKIVGVLTVQISLGEIQELISNKLINGNSIALLNLNNNQFLYKSSELDKINKEILLSNTNNNTVQVITQKDIEYILISSVYNFNRLKMKLLILNSTNNVFSSINNAFNKNILLLSIAILFLALIMFVFIKYSFKPLNTLTNEIEELSGKINIDKRSISDKHFDEITSIKQNFDLFVELISDEREKLQNYNENLKSKVAEEVRKNQEKEQALAQSAKLASMGEMIGNIAHQWRQPLSVITTSASGMELKSDYDILTKDDIKEFSNKIIDQANYLSNTIDDFKNFIKGDIKYLNISLKDVLKETLSLIDATLKNNYITLISDIDEDIDIYGNKNELSQALINIINNSKDAMKGIDEEKLLFISTKKLNKTTLELKILDNGGGIPPDIINRIFEPYFTTKHQSVGTGIGLSMVHQIIKERHNAIISVHNEAYEYNGKTYKGACFKIIFKLQEQK